MTTVTRLASASSPVLGDVSGAPVVLRYGDVAAEYEALRGSAMLVDRSHRARTRVRGASAGDALTGLVTNDVRALAPGHGQYAAALTAKGKIVADLRIFALEDSYLVDCSARAASGWRDILRKYVNPRLAKWTDETGTTQVLGVFGDRARHIVAEVLGCGPAPLAAIAPYGHAAVQIKGEVVVVVRTPELNADGFELWAPPVLSAMLGEALVGAGAVPAGLDAWEIARIEAGRPEWGLDMDDTTLFHEAALDALHAVSYTKGCYTGQEVVARLHFRGHVNRLLRGLTLSDAVPPIGATIEDESGTSVGETRSSARSPRHGPIALAMVRRTAEIGTSLRVKWADGESAATVVALPFPV